MMDELALIKERHSVRTYKPVRIEPEKIDLLKKKIDEINSESGLHIQFMEEAGKVYTKLFSKLLKWKNVPSYIALVGTDDENLEEKCGYYGEKFVLYAQSLGLNTCWAGMYKKEYVTAEIGENEKLALTIAIGYGETPGKPRKSKSIEDVTDVEEMPDWFRNGIECALLAPTAINQQKFFFTLEDGVPKAKVSAKGPFVKVDLGIAKYHFEVGSGKKF